MKVTKNCMCQIVTKSNSTIWASRLISGSDVKLKENHLTILDLNSNPMLDTDLENDCTVLLDGKKLTETKKANE